MRAELEQRQDAARDSMRRGVVWLAFVPIVVLGAIGAALTIPSVAAAAVVLVFASIYTLGGGIGGVFMILAGATERRRISKQLREIDEQRQLPEARVVLR